MAIALTPQQAYPNSRYTPEQLQVLRRTSREIGDLESAIDLLDERFASIVGRPRAGRERVGLLLSGGVDSALTLALLIRAGYHPHCFTAGVESSPDVTAARALAYHFGAPWTGVGLTTDSVRARIGPVVRSLGYWGLWSVASGLLLDALLAAAKRAGVHEVWTGGGLDAVFGGAVVKEGIDAGLGDPFHDRFWEQTLALLERHYGAEDPINVYGTIASVHGVTMNMPFEGFPTARLARRLDAGLLYDEDGRDKVPLRRLAERLGVPSELAARPKAAFQSSSGMLGLLTRLMREDAFLWCPEDLDHAPSAEGSGLASPAEEPLGPEVLLGLRYFLARVASDVSPLRLMAAQVSARRRAEAPAPALAASAPRRRARRG